MVRDIENLIEGIAKSGDTYNHLLMENEYQNEQNKQIYKKYLLTRDGFTLLAMGFTGQKALKWKLKYIEAFNKMEKALKEIYHISETAIVNNVMAHLETRFFPEIDNRLSKYEENYRPTHANKISINSYIKEALGELQEIGEVNLVKQRVLLLLNAEAWQDIPYEKLIKNMHLIDESIKAVKNFRTKRQLSFIEE
ncbi:phage regulatory protein Rha [Tissierella creatinophila DSM 6911]|uniref:Phage regulatory protein Rha n=1 Tax=Tissierella creatinophila DSM 6911 TaxID=1123403 RepID=A0A1U7M6G3_TISCR|nr:phage regulatory protein Rha [Tissierella creatinophila DSM 6911]